jgi:hypothetical protein
MNIKIRRAVYSNSLNKTVSIVPLCIIFPLTYVWMSAMTPLGFTLTRCEIKTTRSPYIKQATFMWPRLQSLTDFTNKKSKSDHNFSWIWNHKSCFTLKYWNDYYRGVNFGFCDFGGSPLMLMFFTAFPRNAGIGVQLTVLSVMYKIARRLK